MRRYAPTVLELVPKLRLQARTWTYSQDEADDIVVCCLELAITAAPQFDGDDIEGWLSDLLVTARDRMRKMPADAPTDRSLF
jgi:DNA-directed RNA polymerase specialized sigma24 family protein